MTGNRPPPHVPPCRISSPMPPPPTADTIARLVVDYPYQVAAIQDLCSAHLSNSGPWWMLSWRVRAKPLGVGQCSNGSSVVDECCAGLWGDFFRICPTWPINPTKKYPCQRRVSRAAYNDKHTKERWHLSAKPCTAVKLVELDTERVFFGQYRSVFLGNYRYRTREEISWYCSVWM
jgi:hypothetical protein